MNQRLSFLMSPSSWYFFKNNSPFWHLIICFGIRYMFRLFTAKNFNIELHSRRMYSYLKFWNHEDKQMHNRYIRNTICESMDHLNMSYPYCTWMSLHTNWSSKRVTIKFARVPTLISLWKILNEKEKGEGRLSETDIWIHNLWFF